MHYYNIKVIILFFKDISEVELKIEYFDNS